jgi:hypothetical protein
MAIMIKAQIQTVFVWKVLLTAPILIFLCLSFFAVRRGQEISRHSQCTTLWQNQQWQELNAMGENLWQAGKADTETLYFAMFASIKLKDSESIQNFNERLIEQKALNRNIEKNIRTMIPPASFLSIIRLHRTDAILVIFLFLTLLCLISMKRPRALPWISAVAILGILILQI